MSLNPNIESWLDSKVNDPVITDIFDPNYLPTVYSRHPIHVNDYHLYYLDENDTDLRASKRFMVYRDIEPEMENYVDKFRSNTRDEWNTHENENDKDVFIPPHSNRYHANLLFKRLMDYCVNNNLTYKCRNPYTGNIEEVPLIYTDFKNAFYKFCYDNTYKNKRR